jgi:hypothetical protein
VTLPNTHQRARAGDEEEFRYAFDANGELVISTQNATIDQIAQYISGGDPQSAT